MNKTIVKCDFCGADILRYSSNVKERNYCNRKCWGKHLSILRKSQAVNDGLVVNQEQHKIAPVEVIEILQMYLSPEEFRGYLRGNMLKYLLQIVQKDENEKELARAYQYSKWLRQAVGGETINPRQED